MSYRTCASTVASATWPAMTRATRPLPSTRTHMSRLSPTIARAARCACPCVLFPSASRWSRGRRRPNPSEASRSTKRNISWRPDFHCLLSETKLVLIPFCDNCDTYALVRRIVYENYIFLLSNKCLCAGSEAFQSQRSRTPTIKTPKFWSTIFVFRFVYCAFVLYVRTRHAWRV